MWKRKMRRLKPAAANKWLIALRWQAGCNASLLCSQGRCTDVWWGHFKMGGEGDSRLAADLPLI